jgi:hypothetical protein
LVQQSGPCLGKNYFSSTRLKTSNQVILFKIRSPSSTNTETGILIGTLIASGIAGNDHEGQIKISETGVAGIQPAVNKAFSMPAPP